MPRVILRASHARVFFASEFDKNMLTSLQGQVVPKFGKLECGGKESSDYRYDFRARRIDVNNFPFPLWNKTDQ